MASVRLRPVRPVDLSRIVDLNNAAYPAVPNADVAELGRLIAFPGLSLVAEHEGSVVGFLLAMDPGADYESENYRFFSERGPSLYIDRIVIDRGLRGAGVGRALYEAVFDKARADGRPEVTCEVNLQPPNPESLAFHSRLGFERVGEQDTKGGQYTVALLAAPVR
ncbi:GNAT family N-acetyltransferase [Naasia sp. SYSU D00948]|uniref:GNAT family N-acetyltransferase n=1 Tax=Naasia sp. SYSU D00948 TaxID=2817379 RepID=UPI0027DCAD47|nr:GNAT family N-acetyltransferase [Naasia sp. SYSU D00948]